MVNERKLSDIFRIKADKETKEPFLELDKAILKLYKDKYPDANVFVMPIELENNVFVISTEPENNKSKFNFVVDDTGEVIEYQEVKEVAGTLKKYNANNLFEEDASLYPAVEDKKMAITNNKFFRKFIDIDQNNPGKPNNSNPRKYQSSEFLIKALAKKFGKLPLTDKKKILDFKILSPDQSHLLALKCNYKGELISGERTEVADVDDIVEDEEKVSITGTGTPRKRLNSWVSSFKGKFSSDFIAIVQDILNLLLNPATILIAGLKFASKVGSFVYILSDRLRKGWRNSLEGSDKTLAQRKQENPERTLIKPLMNFIIQAPTNIWTAIRSLTGGGVEKKIKNEGASKELLEQQKKDADYQCVNLMRKYTTILERKVTEKSPLYETTQYPQTLECFDAAIVGRPPLKGGVGSDKIGKDVKPNKIFKDV
jgi:hypothetical protein